jgi:membrane-associated phospholipid phosphatase
LLLAVSLAAFGALAGLSVRLVTVDEETDALRELRAESPPAFVSTMRTVSAVGGGTGVTAVAIAVAVWLLLRRMPAMAAVFAVMMVGPSLNGLLKVLFDRERPDLWAGPTPFSGLAFPSGHAMSSATLVAALVALTWPSRWRWPVLLVGGAGAFIVGLSRLVLGAHYPTDVLGGWAFAVAWVSGVYLAAGSVRHPRSRLDDRSASGASSSSAPRGLLASIP